MGYLSALLVRIHVLMGLVLGVFFAAFGLSGAFLAFRPDLEERLYWPVSTVGGAPAAAAAAAGDLESGRWEEVAARLSSEEGMRIAEVKIREGRAWQFVIQRRDGSGVQSVYIDPRDGRELARRSHADSIFDWMYRLHTSLLLGGFGMQLAVRLALLLVLQGVLGLVVWRLRGFPMHLHALLGVSSGIVCVFLAFSGWRIYTTRITSVQPVVTLRGVENKVSLDRIVKTALARRPGKRLAGIKFPGAPSQPFQFWFGERPSEGIVYMDPYGAALPMMMREEDDTTRHWHGGPAGGGGARLVRLLAGLGLVGLFASGVWMRLRKAKANGSSPVRAERG
jgi:uncharacterized iron-regulated membrane protein